MYYLIKNRLCHKKKEKSLLPLRRHYLTSYNHHICDNKKTTTERLSFTINHNLNGECDLAQAFWCLICKYNINLSDGSKVFTMPKETALKLKKESLGSPRFKGLKPLFKGSKLYTDGVRK